MKIPRKNTGEVLGLAVLAMVILLVTGGGLLALGFQSRVYQARTAFDIAARCAADAGITKAFYEINTLFTNGQLFGELPAESYISLTGSDSDYSYTITVNGGVYTITSTGRSHGAQHTVEATLITSNPFDFAVFSKEDMVMRNSAEIDWYNYDAFSDPLKVGTNSKESGSVDLKNSIKVYGDVVVGAGADPDEVLQVGTSSYIYGDTYAQLTDVILPSVTVPNYLQSAPSSGNINNDTTITTSGKYDGINLGNSEEITVSGAVEIYITGNIDLGNSAKIELDNSDPDSSLTIYLNGNLVTQNSSELNNETEIPENFKLYCTDNCTSLDFRNSSTIYGVIYAPEADVIFHNSIDIYGSMIGKSMDLKNSAKIMYDASLREADSDGLVCLKMNRWKE